MESELLYKAAVTGNVPALRELLEQDKQLLHKIMSGNHTKTPLHIAAMLGHLEFVKEVLDIEPILATAEDFQSSTPLHLAAERGYLEIVEILVKAHPEVCSSLDKYGRNPLHVAAMKGHMHVLELLARARPDAARSVTEHGQTILHLCMKHNRLDALRLSIDILDDDQFVNSKNKYGDTILHLAAAYRQTEIFDFLINKGVNPNTKNSRGFTAFDLLAQGESAGRASEIKGPDPQFFEDHYPSERRAPAVQNQDEQEDKMKREWQNSMHQALLVVATLLATVAFQAGISPPGGLWDQDDRLDDKKSIAPAPGAGHKGEYHDASNYHAGESIMAYRYSYIYETFVVCNTVSFIASLSVIMILISGLPPKRLPITMWIAMPTMWVGLTFTAITYTISVVYQLSGASPGRKTIPWAVGPVAGLMALLFQGHFFRLIAKLVCKVLKFFRERLGQTRSRR